MTAEQKEERRKKKKHQRLVSMYRRRRKALIILMGAECECCGKKRKLEFHHPDGRDWDIRKFSRWSRIVKYEKDFAAGNLRLRCRSCNAGYNPKREKEYPTDDYYDNI